MKLYKMIIMESWSVDPVKELYQLKRKIGTPSKTLLWMRKLITFTDLK